MSTETPRRQMVPRTSIEVYVQPGGCVELFDNEKPDSDLLHICEWEELVKIVEELK
jgi:hypothetical protein